MRVANTEICEAFWWDTLGRNFYVYDLQKHCLWTLERPLVRHSYGTFLWDRAFCFWTTTWSCQVDFVRCQNVNRERHNGGKLTETATLMRHSCRTFKSRTRCAGSTKSYTLVWHSNETLGRFCKTLLENHSWIKVPKIWPVRQRFTNNCCPRGANWKSRLKTEPLYPRVDPRYQKV